MGILQFANIKITCRLQSLNANKSLKQYNSLMVVISCSGCGNSVFNVANVYRTHIYTICSVCITDNKAINYVKSYHQLIEKSQFTSVLNQRDQGLKTIERLNQTVRQLEDFTFKKYFQKGSGLNNFLTQKLCEYMQSYNTLVEKIKTQSPSLKGLANRSIKTTLKQVERNVMSIIALEAETLAQNISLEDKDNEKRITKAELTREKIIREMSEVKIESSHRDLSLDKDQNPEIQEFVFSKAEMAGFIKIIENNIQESKANGLVLSSLIKEGEKIASELSREEKQAMKASRTSSANASTILSKSITEEQRNQQET